MVYIANACPRTLAHMDQGKYIKNPPVPCVADTACDSFVNADTKCAGVGNRDFTEFFVNHNAASAIKIGVDQGICETFPKRFMNGSIIYTQ